MYSYKEQAAYLTILYAALIMGIAYFLLRYANRSLFKWHTVRAGLELRGGGRDGRDACLCVVCM